MSSATDELRRLLDERGAEYTFIPRDEYSREHIKIGSTEIWTNDRDEVAVYFLTPEQAVEATLGSDLQAENAKLRELVHKVEHYEQYGCHECPHGGSCDVGTLYDESCAMSLEIEREKRELGIEVDA